MHSNMATHISIKSRSAVQMLLVALLFGAGTLFQSISALEILTDKTVSLWMGRRYQRIHCNVTLRPNERMIGFSWAVHNVSDVYVKRFIGVVGGPGIESGNFNLTEDNSLVINRPVTIADEGIYYCIVVVLGASQKVYNSSTIRVLSAPEEPYPVIPECANRHEEEREEGTDGKTCKLKQDAGKSLNLTCNVRGFRPMVDLVWTNGTQDVNEVFRTLVNNSDGTQDLSVRFEVTASLERQTFHCKVSGESVQGQERRSEVVIEGYRVEEESPLVIIIIIVVAVSLVVVVVVILVVALVVVKFRRKSRRSRERTKSEKEAEAEKGADYVRAAEINHYTIEPVLVPQEESAPVEMEDTKLHESTQTDIPDPEDDEDDRHSSASEESEQQQELLTDQDREHSQPSSHGPSEASSRNDIAQHEFGESWVCVDLKDLNKIQSTTADEEDGEEGDAGTSAEYPQRTGPISSVLHGFGNLLNTFNDFIRHDA